MKKTYIDSLIEAWQSFAGIISAEDKAIAKKAYEDHAKEGWLDLENFHRAYDDDLAADNLIDANFDNDGALKGKWTYGACKDADTPGKKAMKQLWVYTYSTGGTINKNGRDIQISSKVLLSKDEYDKKQEQDKYDKFIAELRNSIQTILRQKLADLVKEHQDLAIRIYNIDANDTGRLNKIKRDFDVIVYVTPLYAEFGTYEISVDTYEADLNYAAAQARSLSKSIKANWKTDDVRDVFKEIYYEAKNELTQVIEDEKATLGRVKIINDICKKYNYKLNKSEKFYFKTNNGQFVYINLDKEPVLLEVDTDMPVKVDHPDDLIPAALQAFSGYEGHCYHKSDTYSSWNSKILSKKEMDTIGVYNDESEGKAKIEKSYGRGYSLTDGTGPYSHYYKLPGFDKFAHESFEIDSSD